MRITLKQKNTLPLKKKLRRIAKNFFSDKWGNVNGKISDIVKAYNKERIKEAFKNNVSSEVN